MFVHAFLIVASGQVLYVSHAKCRAYVICAWSAHVVSGPVGQRVQLSRGAMARVYVPSTSAWYKHLMRRSLGTTVVRITRKASRVSRLLLYPGCPSPQGIEYSYHAAGAMARVRARAVHLHGINTLYHAVSVYTGMHKTLETIETLALRAWVSKPVSAVLYIPVYTSTAWYNLYVWCNQVCNIH